MGPSIVEISHPKHQNYQEWAQYVFRPNNWNLNLLTHRHVVLLGDKIQSSLTCFSNFLHFSSSHAFPHYACHCTIVCDHFKSSLIVALSLVIAWILATMIPYLVQSSINNLKAWRTSLFFVCICFTSTFDLGQVLIIIVVR